MAGHSKWANIKHRKGAQDARRGKLFTKLIREITAATRMSGSDPGSNPRLRTAIDKALMNNMTRDTVDRAIKRGAGAADNDHYEEVRYEGYGPNGVAIMVDCLTDNRNRTVGEVRHAFTKHGGNLGTDGSVAYLFSSAGILTYPPGSNEDAVMNAALDAGADDIVTNEDGSIEVYTEPDAMKAVAEAMTKAGLPPAASAATMKAATYVELEFEDAESVVKLVERLEDLDDVQEVYTNADFSAEVMEKLAS